MSTRLDAVAAALERRLPGGVERDAASADLTTYRVGGPIGVLVRARSLADLAAVREVAGSRHPELLIVGRGSNLLVSDRGFDGVGVVLEGEFEHIETDPATASVVAGGSVSLPVLARRAAAVGIGGLEFYVGIPGSVGGAVRMNAGGHGSTTRDVLVSASVFDLADGETRIRDVGELELGYRSSSITSTEVVTEATVRGRRDERERCEERLADIVRWRRENQPGGANAGSVFTNPPDVAAARLIDDCGLKGLRVGGAVVSAKHANFIQADANATASDVFRLVGEVRSRVEAATGVRLEPELRLVGFGEDRL